VSSRKTGGVIVLILAVGAFMLLPFFVAVMSPSPEQPAQQEALDSTAESIAAQTGLQLCKAGPVSISYPGVELAFLYQIAADCAAFSTGDGGISVLAIAFSSPEEREAAEQEINAALEQQGAEDISVAGSGTTLLVAKGLVFTGT
jgi:hypothetical protein